METVREREKLREKVSMCPFTMYMATKPRLGGSWSREIGTQSVSHLGEQEPDPVSYHGCCCCGCSWSEGPQAGVEPRCSDMVHASSWTMRSNTWPVQGLWDPLLSLEASFLTHQRCNIFVGWDERFTFCLFHVTLLEKHISNNQKPEKQNNLYITWRRNKPSVWRIPLLL